MTLQWSTTDTPLKEITQHNDAIILVDYQTCQNQQL